MVSLPQEGSAAKRWNTNISHVALSWPKMRDAVMKCNLALLSFYYRWF
jgi:hypothetical protein